MPSTPCIPVIKTVVFAAQAEAVCLVGIGFLPKSERAARPAVPRRPAGPLTEFSSDRRQLLDDPRSAAEEQQPSMRVNAAKGITSNQPLIADCRPLMLGRQEADLDLAPSTWWTRALAPTDRG